ncbi:restriction endonuclease subunit S [Vibrio metoecus]|uniref:restriction endonuclease subunit S n=1 Tax=Vibrio metoecus TaxID=1481663 RepID=UPI0012ADD7C1|nr:restriction endonuclease subunit S [Vibrio metoecus]
MTTNLSTVLISSDEQLYASSSLFKNTELGAIPIDWELASIENALANKHIFDQMDGNHGELYPKSHEFSSYGVPYIGATDFSTGRIDYKGCKYLPEQRAKKFKKGIARNGDVLFAHNATVGPVALVETTLDFVILSTTATYYRCNPEKINNHYLYHFFSSDFFVKQYSSVMSQSTRNQVPILAQRKFLLVLPPLTEQIAIANALSDVDALIQELEKLIAKKQAIKTATMQQLLTGRTRLPQFAHHPDGSKKGYKPSELGEIPEDWSVSPLKELLRENPKYGINAAAVPLEGNLPVYIRITDISEDGYFKPSEKVGVKSPFSGMYQLADGDIVLARTGASVGKSYLYRAEDGILVYAGFLIKISPEQSILEPKFLIQYLKTEQYWSWVTVNSMRSGQPGINGNEYGSLLIPCPTKEEQIAIATILSDMDKDVQSLENRLNKTRQIKQGMMQELLTGKTRLV